MGGSTSINPTSFTQNRTIGRGALCTAACCRAGSATRTGISAPGWTPSILDHDRVPRLEDVNRFLQPLTGFQAKAVSGYVPTFLFFDSLRNREFPTTITIRRGDHLDYLPEPDIFHDVAGHVPMHTDKHFAEALVRFGECAHTAAALAADIQDPAERVHTVTNIIKAMARFFWFTIEFGLMSSSDGLKVYGSGSTKLLWRD